MSEAEVGTLLIFYCRVESSQFINVSFVIFFILFMLGESHVEQIYCSEIRVQGFCQVYENISPFWVLVIHQFQTKRLKL